jgi:hypothetical protein
MSLNTHPFLPLHGLRRIMQKSRHTPWERNKPIEIPLVQIQRERKDPQ